MLFIHRLNAKEDVFVNSVLNSTRKRVVSIMGVFLSGLIKIALLINVCFYYYKLLSIVLIKCCFYIRSVFILYNSYFLLMCWLIFLSNFLNYIINISSQSKKMMNLTISWEKFIWLDFKPRNLFLHNIIITHHRHDTFYYQQIVFLFFNIWFWFK